MATYKVIISGHTTVTKWLFARRHNKQCPNCVECYLDVMPLLRHYHPFIETSQFEKMNYKVQKISRMNGDEASERFSLEGSSPDKCIIVGTVDDSQSEMVIRKMSCANDEFEEGLRVLKSASEAGGISHLVATHGEHISFHDLGIEKELLEIMENEKLTREHRLGIVEGKIKGR